MVIILILLVSIWVSKGDKKMDSFGRFWCFKLAFDLLRSIQNYLTLYACTLISHSFFISEHGTRHHTNFVWTTPIFCCFQNKDIYWAINVECIKCSYMIKKCLVLDCELLQEYLITYLVKFKGSKSKLKF